MRSMVGMVGLFRRSFTWSRRHRAAQTHSKDYVSQWIPLPRHRYHSGSKRLPPNEAQGSPFRTISVATLVGLGYAVHLYSNSTPLVLENWSSVNTDGDRPGVRRTDHVSRKLDIDQADAILRWAEESDAIGEGSGILRTDCVSVPSNYPCEDEYFYRTLGYERDTSTYANLRWMMWGVFDGHV